VRGARRNATRKQRIAKKKKGEASASFTRTSPLQHRAIEAASIDERVADSRETIETSAEHLVTYRMIIDEGPHYCSIRTCSCLARAIEFRSVLANVNVNTRDAQIAKSPSTWKESGAVVMQSTRAVSLPPSLGPSIPRPRVYSNCTDTSDLCAPHYQPLENHRLRRGPHVVSAHYPASIFRNFSPTRALSPPRVARNPARHVKRFLLCSSLFAEHSHEIRSRT